MNDDLTKIRIIFVALPFQPENVVKMEEFSSFSGTNHFLMHYVSMNIVMGKLDEGSVSLSVDLGSQKASFYSKKFMFRLHVILVPSLGVRIAGRPLAKLPKTCFSIY